MPAGPLCWEEDILGTGSVMKRRLRKSASSVGPDYKQEVKVRFECWAVNRPEQRHIALRSPCGQRSTSVLNSTVI